MARFTTLSFALAAAVSVSARQTPQQTNALAGAAIGAGSGALIGSAATPQPTGQCARWGYDYNGNQVCTAYY